MLSDDSDDVHLESTASRYRWLRACPHGTAYRQEQLEGTVPDPTNPTTIVESFWRLADKAQDIAEAWQA